MSLCTDDGLLFPCIDGGCSGAIDMTGFRLAVLLPVYMCHVLSVNTTGVALPVKITDR